MENLVCTLVPTRITDKPETAAADAIASAHRSQDLMYLTFELMHANVNRNKDEFTPEELKKNFKTAVAKPINWEHTNEIIGHIYESEFVPFEGASGSAVNTRTDKVVCHGVVYKYRFPSRAKEMAKRYGEDNLFFSMETYFQKAQCSVCQADFPAGGPYCTHLEHRWDVGSSAARRLLDINICGAGCVEHPADDARGLSVASVVNRDANISLLIDYLGTKFTVAQYIAFLDAFRARK